MLNEYTFDHFYIRHAIDDTPSVADYGMHIHEQCEIYFFLSGQVDYLVEGSSYQLKPRSVMIMRPAEAHKAMILAPTRYERFALNFPLDFLEQIDPKATLLVPFLSRELGQDNLFTEEELDMELMYRLFWEMCTPADDYTRRVTIRTHLYLMIDLIHQAFLKRSDPKHLPNTMEANIIRYVNAHLFEDINVPLLSKHFYLSPSQFSRIFKKATGSAPWEYILRKRLTAAKEKIRSKVPAQTACFSCGFHDYSSFYRAYTKYFGTPPKG